MMTIGHRLLATAIIATSLAAGCSSNPARSSAAVPLQIPEPPPRVAMEPVPAAGPPAVVPIPEAPRAAPPPDLLPAGGAGRTPTSAQVRDVLNRTKQKLDQIDRRRLNAGKRADFDSARQFLAHAETAMKANNLMLA